MTWPTERQAQLSELVECGSTPAKICGAREPYPRPVAGGEWAFYCELAPEHVGHPGVVGAGAGRSVLADRQLAAAHAALIDGRWITWTSGT